MSQLQSPCVLICAIDQKSGLCFGCGRTGAEITQWIDYTQEERSHIMDTLKERLSTLKRKPRKETKRKRFARLSLTAGENLEISNE